MKKLIRVSFIVLAVSVLVVGVFGSTGAEEKSIVEISQMGAGISASSYILATASADISRKYHPWLRVNAVSTPGSLYIMRAIHKDKKLWENTIGAWGKVTVWLGSNGLPPFKEPVHGFRALLNLNVLTQWLVTLNPKIKKPQDLAGKKIALGKAAQVNWGYEPAVMINDGWNLKDKVHISYVGTSAALQALIDGTADAAVIGIYLDPITYAYVPTPTLVELVASGKKFYHLPWGRECIKSATAKTGLPMGSIAIPAGKISGQTEEIVTYMDNLFLGVKGSFPEEVAYEFVKMWLSNYEKFKEYHAVGKLISPKAMHYGLSRNDLHPGAVRAYEEAGFTIP